MPYDIFGVVEVKPTARGAWQAAWRLEEIVSSPSAFSIDAFGLAKYTQAGNAHYENRGLPDDASSAVADYLAQAAAFQLAEPSDPGDHGHTFATMEELKRLDFAGDVAWGRVFARVAELQREHGYADSDVRIVLWANW